MCLYLKCLSLLCSNTQFNGRYGYEPVEIWDYEEDRRTTKNISGQVPTEPKLNKKMLVLRNHDKSPKYEILTAEAKAYAIRSGIHLIFADRTLKYTSEYFVVGAGKRKNGFFFAENFERPHAWDSSREYSLRRNQPNMLELCVVIYRSEQNRAKFPLLWAVRISFS